MKKLITGKMAFVLLASCTLLLSCSKDDGDSGSDKPVIILNSPTGDINIGSDIQVDLEFTDNNGLQEVEIRLGNLKVTGNVYDLVQRGLSGTSDALSYTVSPPPGIDISGSNYIYISCKDVDGNETILDRDFDIVDKQPPTLDVLAIDDIDIFSGGPVYTYYECYDIGGVEYSATELWMSDAAGSLVSMEDIDENNFSSPPTTTTSINDQVGTNWTSGIYYKLVIKARDVSGNVETFESHWQMP